MTMGWAIVAIMTVLFVMSALAWWLSGKLTHTRTNSLWCEHYRTFADRYRGIRQELRDADPDAEADWLDAIIAANEAECARFCGKERFYGVLATTARGNAGGAGGRGRALAGR